MLFCGAPAGTRYGLRISMRYPSASVVPGRCGRPKSGAPGVLPAASGTPLPL